VSNNEKKIVIKKILSILLNETYSKSDYLSLLLFYEKLVENERKSNLFQDPD